MANSTYQTTIFEVPGTVGLVGQANTLRTRVVTADVNSGKTLLPAVPGYKYQLLDAWMLAYGGAAGTCTSVNIAGTASAGAVQLVVFARTSLSQSTLLRAGASGAVILADGASFVELDANKAITLQAVSATLATCTGIDVCITYRVVEA